MLADKNDLEVYQILFKEAFGEELDYKDIMLMEKNTVHQKIQQCFDMIGKRKVHELRRMGERAQQTCQKKTK